VLNTHQQRPTLVIPSDNTIVLFDNIEDGLFNLKPIVPGFLDSGPVVMLRREIIPTHLVDSDSKNRLQSGVYAVLQKIRLDGLVNVKDCSMTKIED